MVLVELPQHNGLWSDIPLGQNQVQNISSEDESQGTRMLLVIFIGYVKRRMVRWLACSRQQQTGEICEPLKNYIKWFKHHEVAQKGELLFPCADGTLKFSDLLAPPRGDRPVLQSLKETSEVVGLVPLQKQD